MVNLASIEAITQEPHDFNRVECQGKLGKIRGLVVNKEPWFVVKDICNILEIKNVTQAVTALDDDEKGIYPTYTLGGKQKLWLVNEWGMYSLILKSKTKEAKKFKRWITHEVLPQIMRTGSYMATAEDLQSLEYQNIRKIGKDTRHQLTDEIQKIEEAYKSFGHNHKFVYSNFTKLIKKKTNTENIGRDKLSEEALEKTKFYEEIAISVIQKQISKGLQTYEDWQNIYYIFLNVLDNYI